MKLNVTVAEFSLILTALESHAVRLRDCAEKHEISGHDENSELVKDLRDEAGKCYDLCRKLRTQKK